MYVVLKELSIRKMTSLNFDLSVGTVYPSPKDAIDAVFSMISARGESFLVKKSEKKRWIATCRNKDCHFRIRISTVAGTGKITINEPHSCPPESHANWHSANSVRVLAQHHRKAVVDNRNIAPRQIISNERLQHGNTVPYHQAWRTREALRQEMEGSEEESFKKLPAMCEAMRAGDIGTYCEMETRVNRFFRLFVAPGSSRHGWPSCQQLLAVDGTFLKGPYKMTLLAAVTLDGNNEILPLAWGIVPGECDEHWTWFLAHLRQAFPSMSGPTLVVISDREKGLEGAMAKTFPIAQHCHCCQHLADNIQARFGMACQKLFWKAAYAITELAFREAIRELGEEKAAYKTYLEGIPP